MITQSPIDSKIIPSSTIKKASSPLSKKTKKKSNNNNKTKKNNNWSITNYFTSTTLTTDAHDIDTNDTSNDLMINKCEV